MMQRMLITTFAVLVGLSVSVASVMAADVGRYQIVVVHATGGDGMVVLKLDTITGKTWIFNSESFEVADAEYFERQKMDYSHYKDMEKQGWLLYVLPYWKETSERPAGVGIRSKPTPK
jgi:hypothetical protein